MTRRIAAIIIAISTYVGAEDMFVIGAYGVERIVHIQPARNLLKLNTIIYGWPSNQTQADSILLLAEKDTLNVILAHAPGADPDISRRLSWYSHLWSKSWQSDSDYFFHKTGSRTQDAYADNHYAWKCRRNLHTSGLMQYGPSGRQARLPCQYLYLDTVEYNARFKLRIDTTAFHSAVKVCSLSVYCPQEESIYADTVLRIKDFPANNKYGSFDLYFFRTKPFVSTNQYEYRIWWYNNTNLWSDYVEVKNYYTDTLIEGGYDSKISSILDHYRDFPMLYRYYLTDEPYIGHFAANRYITHYLKARNRYGIQALGTSTSEFYAHYLSYVEPKELMFDYYPICGSGDRKRGRTPEEHGRKFQAMLDSLCTHLSEMRAVALEHNTKWLFIPQTFGKYNTLTAIDPDDGGAEGDWRLPTPREIRCIVWLSIAHGAKGIIYFRFRTRLTNESGFPEWMRGLWRYDNRPREPLFTEVRNINDDLHHLGPILLTLTSHRVFNARAVPQESFIKYINTLHEVQIGTFYDSHKDTFFVMVNRHCRSIDSIRMKIGVATRGAKTLYLLDCLTKNRIYPVHSDLHRTSTVEVIVDLQPGQGRLFKLVRIE
ncbi:hypothetical protein AMJ83_10125 [candidate division WOR_3 bacterium SM23_42]|uniref:Glycoside hydrolase family 42 N-terminal domain-containing protein n=1 Tax=candidate division WOR_3 bacterium SM23_42 TaxID=1703779 RepID=A0A0S8FT05_UNCW3|nr:MAG: hypothetical protein AMJ83_10125 [candidate division WOR_3 bacterium SM23_42]